MRFSRVSNLVDFDPVQGFRFWGRQPFSRDLVKPLEEGDESGNQKPVSGLWLSPLMHGHTDCWEEFLDSVGWHGRIPHRVEVDPDTLTLVLDSAKDLEEYEDLFCTSKFLPHLKFFDPAKFLPRGIPAVYISRRGVGHSKRNRNFMAQTWDVPSLWVNDPEGVHLQRVETETLELDSAR